MGDKIPETLRSLLRQKLIDAVQLPLPQLTRRDTWIPRIPGKTLAVIGMRRSGKTSLLWQQVGERLAAGAERAWLPLVSFEDERLLAQSPGVELLDDLQQALQEPIGAATQARVISLDRHQPTGEWPEAVSWSSALEWLLQA
jgi:predicted AAA+ superfamily ATPase